MLPIFLKLLSEITISPEFGAKSNASDITT
jgi:hypothetical protein